MLTDMLYQAPDMEAMITGIADFASNVLGDKFASLTDLHKVSRMEPVVEGADSDALAKLV